MKRFLLATAGGVAAVAAIAASAASLGSITGTDVGSGSELVDSCTSSGLALSYTTPWQGGFAVSQVTAVVNGGNVCNGRTARVVLIDDTVTQNDAAQGSGTVTDDSVVITLDDTMLVEDLNEVAVLID